MKILVLNVAADSSGALSILTEFHQYAAENEQEHQWLFIVGTPQLKEAEHIQILRFPEVKKGWIHRLIWEKTTIKKVINDFQPDAILSLQNLCVKGTTIPQILYMHQPIPFQKTKRFSIFKKEERRLAIYQYVIGRMIKKSIKQAKKVIVQTNWVKDAISINSRIAAKTIVMKPEIEIPKKFINSSTLINQQPIQTKKFFFPATALIYKNHQCIIDAARSLIAEGFYDFEISFTLSQENPNVLKLVNEASGLEKQIHFDGQLARENVFKQYQDSVLLFPSYIETLGLPLIEARMIGTVIFAADCEFAKETLSGYENAYFFNPFEPKELADLIKKCITNEINYQPVKSNSVDITGWDKLMQVLKEAVN